MKKIIVLSGSGRKNGIGIKTLDMLKEKFPKDKYEFETVFLSDYSIQFCKGCGICFKNGVQKCPMRNDEVESIVEKIKGSQGVIFVTPIYGMNVSGSMKTFIDRTSYMFHQPRLFNKTSMIIVSTDIAGIKPVTAYLNHIMEAYGINNVGTIGVKSFQFINDLKYKRNVENRLEKVSDKFKREIDRKENCSPKLLQVIKFNVWKEKTIISKNVYSEDFLYWEGNNWIQADYYYPIKMSWMKKGFVKFLSKIIGKRLKSKII